MSYENVVRGWWDMEPIDIGVVIPPYDPDLEQSTVSYHSMNHWGNWTPPDHQPCRCVISHLCYCSIDTLLTRGCICGGE